MVTRIAKSSFLMRWQIEETSFVPDELQPAAKGHQIYLRQVIVVSVLVQILSGELVLNDRVLQIANNMTLQNGGGDGISGSKVTRRLFVIFPLLNKLRNALGFSIDEQESGFDDRHP